MKFEYCDNTFFWSPEPSGGGAAVEEISEPESTEPESTPEPVESTETESAEEAAFFGMPDSVSSATQWQQPTPQPQQFQQPPQGWVPQSQPQSQPPLQSPLPTQVPPLPTEDLWTTDPAGASRMIVEHMTAQQAPMQQTLSRLQAENARLQQTITQRGQQMDTDVQNRSVALIHETSKVVNDRLYGTKQSPGFFNRVPEYASDKALRTTVDDFVAKWIGNAAHTLMNSSDANARIHAERQLQWTQDPSFAGKVIALSKDTANVQTFAPVNIKGAHQTDGSPHSSPSGPRLSPEDTEDARISGLDPKLVAAARKLEQESIL